MSKLLLPILCLAALISGGCGIHVVPLPTPETTLNTADNSLTLDHQGVVISARAQDLEVAPYRMVDNITSFYLTIRNRTDQPVVIPLESFVLIDSQGRQYRPVLPTQIQGVVGRDSQYMIPYPYVGYYYLEDFEQYSFANTFTSALPYYAENYPQDLFTRALPIDSILPGALISGEVFFLIDLATKDAFELRVYRPAEQGTEAAYVFPFSVEK